MKKTARKTITRNASRTEWGGREKVQNITQSELQAFKANKKGEKLKEHKEGQSIPKTGKAQEPSVNE